MATLAKPPLRANDPSHIYHAQADVLRADLEQPLREKVERRAFVKLPRDGQYQFKQAEPFRLEGICSYRSGYTQVSGHEIRKREGFATLATSVVEGLNVLDVLTADRVVGQIFTEHPLDGQVPSVSFLGTRFDNLRIAGKPLNIVIDPDALGPKPANDESYFDQKNLLARMSLSHPGELQGSLIAAGQDGQPSSGPMIDIPHFGKIFFAQLKVRRHYAKDSHREIYDKTIDPNREIYNLHLTMIHLELDGPVEGTCDVIELDTNGTGKGSGPKPVPPPKKQPQPPPVMG